MSTHTVSVGERQYTLQSFKGYKALCVGDIVAQITEQVPGVLDAVASFNRKYEQNNTVRITRTMAQTIETFRVATQHVTNKTWDECGGVLELPQSPSGPEQIAAVFPMVFRSARKLVVDLLALIAATNKQLEDADTEGGEEAVEELLTKIGKQLLHEGTLEELMELAAVGSEQIAGQFKADGDPLGRILAAFGMGKTTPEVDAIEAQTATPAAAEQTKKPRSSTPSPKRTGGHAQTPSTTTGGDS